MLLKTALLMLFVSVLGFAQVDRATLTGTVRDATGAIVSGAKVEINADATGLRREVKSNAAGAYEITFLPIGNYTVIISMDGFRAVKVDDVVLQVGQTRTLDISLEVGAVATQVEVEAAATPLDQSSSEIGTVVGESQLKQLPLNGRNWASLMQLAPGATNGGDGSQNSIRFFGRARDENNWTFDGSDATGVKDPRQEASLRLVISMDSIAEFRVSSSMYSAESGVGSGGQVNLVSKTGSNSFHGSAFEFLRNSYFDARRPFDGSSVPPFRLNQFGANIGGPIKTNKTFFYANYEALRQRLAVTSANGQVPSASFRNSVLAASPALKPLIDAFPLGNAGSVNKDIDRYIAVFPQSWTEDSGLIRIDHRVNDKWSIFGRFNTDHGDLTENASALLESKLSRPRTTQAVVSLQRIFGASAVNELKYGFNRSALTRDTTGRIREGISVPGLTSTTATLHELETGNSFSLIDNFSWVKGRHSLKVGFERRRIQVNVGNSASNTLTYSSLDNFIANKADRININGDLATLGGRRVYWSGYAQDEFKLKPNFTINYGVRYEYYTVAKEVNGRGLVLDFERCGGYCAAGTPWYFPDRNNFAPRFSMAWAPNVFKNKTVFRTGYGIFYGPGQVDDVHAAIDSVAERFQLASTDVPGGVLSYPIDSYLPLATSQGLSPRALQRDRRDLYVQNWTFSIQQQLPGQFVGQVAYVGNKGTHVFGRDRLNLLDPITKTRPYAGFNDIDRKESNHISEFHGLQASINRTLVKGWLWQVQYLYGKVIDDSAGSGEGKEIMISSCRACDRGPADFDIRQYATVNSVYDLPFGRGKLWGGWSLSGLYSIRTGRPVLVLVTRSAGAVPDGNTGSKRLRPDAVPGVNMYPANQTPGFYLNPAAFAVPASGTWGNLGRNAARGPGLWQLDTAISKNARITESIGLQFRAEAFNLFNRAQYGDPANNISNGSFGQILTTANDGATGQGTSRQLQFMLRLMF